MPEEQHGQFYVGDAYIVLRTYLSSGNKLCYDLHFWLGDEASQDEKGTCAVKSVELDNRLGGKPIQYRECQGHESAAFHAIFRESGGVVCTKGGIASGFTHVEKDVYNRTLYHLKGWREIRVLEVETSVKSLRKDDVFVLDDGLTIYQWNGPSANKREKFKGLKLVQRLMKNFKFEEEIFRCNCFEKSCQNHENCNEILEIRSKISQFASFSSFAIPKKSH